jgi:hypothetical protein
LVLAAGFDEQDNLAGWWEAIIVRIDDGEFLVRWRDDPKEPRASRSILPFFTQNSRAFDSSKHQKGGGVNHPFCGWQESKHDKADR